MEIGYLPQMQAADLIHNNFLFRPETPDTS